MIYFMDDEQRVIKGIALSETITAIQEMEIKDDSSLLQDVMSVSIKNDLELSEPSFFAVRSDSGVKQSFDMYEIKTKKVDEYTTYIGIQLAVSELGGYVVEDIRPQNRSVGYVANQLLSGTDWEVRYVDGGLPNISTNFYYMSIKDALKWLQSFGCELVFRVEISGNKISAKTVDIYQKMGSRTGRRFTYGSNALKVVQEVSHTEMYSALIGRGRGEEVVNDEGEATGGFGRKITFEDVEWRIADGDPVDKPLGQKYVEIPSATDRYGIQSFDGKKPRIGLVDFSDEEDPEKLLRLTYEQLLRLSRPSVEFASTIADVGDLDIGDTVTIHRHDLGIHYEARVFRIRKNRKNKQLTEVSLGDRVVVSSVERQRKVNSHLKGITDAQTQLREEINSVVIDGSGNKVTYGNIEPTNNRVGDEWYREHPSLAGESQILVWNGEVWELIIDTSETTKNANAIAEQQQKVEEAKQEAENAYTNAVTEAERLVDEQTVAFDAIIETVNEDILNVKNNADRAIASIDTAVANAGFTSLDATLADMSSIGNQAKADATTALSQAQSAVAVAGGVSGRITTVENSVDDINGVLVNKVSTVDFNNLTGRVGIAETTISQHDSAISLRATKTEAQGYAQSAIDGLEIGGRNLFSVNRYVSLRNSEGTSNGNWYSVGSTGALVLSGVDSSGAYDTMKMVDLKANTEYIFTFNVPMNDRFSFYNTDGVAVNVTKNWSSDNTQLTFKMVVDGYIGGKFYPVGQVDQAEIYLMAEKGNKATDWTPAPEDVDASIAVVQSNLSVEAGKIALSATKTELTTAINSIQVGGRNLLKNSSVVKTGVNEYLMYENIAPVFDEHGDGEYTFSFDLKLNVAGSVNVYCDDRALVDIKYTFPSRTFTATTEYKRYSMTVRVTKNSSSLSNAYHTSLAFYGTYNTGRIPSVKNVKIEKGNKATDWTPALEDVEASITTVSSALNVEVGKITAVTARVGVAESSIASVKQTADGNTATVANHTGQISTINQTVSGLQTTVASKANQSQVTQLANGLSSVVTDLSNLEVGGRNYFSNKKPTAFNTNNEYILDAYLNVGSFTQFSNLTVPMGTFVGQEMVLSFECISPNGATPLAIYNTNGNPRYLMTVTGIQSPIGNVWVKQVLKMTVTDRGSAYSEGMSNKIEFYASGKMGVKIRNVKLEKGNKATDWTPAPEDMATESRVTQLENNINLRIVEKGNVVAQLNIDNGTTLISNKKLLLDANTYVMGTTFVNDLKAKSIEAVNANIASIRSSILTADVITSTMVATSTALITKIFATDATVTTLTGKTAFINSIKAITISADKVTTGTLNAANVSIVNLNVSKLVGNITTFVQSAWNTINSSVSITGDGIVSSNSAGRFVHYSNGGVVFGGGGERTVLRNNTGATTNRSGISLEPVGSNLNGVDFDIYTRGTSAFHMGTSDYDLGYRLRLANNETNTNNYYISLKTGSQFDFQLGQSTAANTAKNTLEIQRYDANGNIRIGKNATYGASMFISGSDIIFAKGGTSSRVNVFANRFTGTGYTYLEGSNIYSIEKTISHIIQQLQWYTSYFSATKWQNA